jgi:biopolymer transport protein ExbD
MPLKTFRDEEPTINLTPMIDVVFQLVIFFMVGTTFSQMDRHIELQVPEVNDRGALTSAPEKRVVSVLRDGRITLDDEFVTLPELEKQLAAVRAQYPGLGVTVRGDGRASFQPVADVLNACKQAGISELAISVRLAQPKTR